MFGTKRACVCGHEVREERDDEELYEMMIGRAARS